MIESIQKLGLFSIPIYKMKFSHHEQLKQQFIDYMETEDEWALTTSPTLKFTQANLHKVELFEPFVEFAEAGLKRVMDDQGFIPSIKLTGMWGTKHDDGGFHHRHTHHNSFLAGVYYLHGNNNSSGTNFYNFHHYNTMIHPARQKGKTEPRNTMFMHTERFEEGTLVIFPAWLPHDTARNNLERTNSERMILSFNSMPVGQTNVDMFDRYDFPDPSKMKLISKLEQKFDHRPKS